MAKRSLLSPPAQPEKKTAKGIWISGIVFLFNSSELVQQSKYMLLLTNILTKLPNNFKILHLDMTKSDFNPFPFQFIISVILLAYVTTLKRM